MSATVNNFMERIGVPPDADGENVAELRAWISKQVAGGMVNMSGGTWMPGSESLSPDERARQFLAMMWSVGRYSRKAAFIDGPPIRVVTDVATMKRRVRVNWRKIVPWVAEVIAAKRLRLRRWFDENVRGIRNPYLANPKTDNRP